MLIDRAWLLVACSSWYPKNIGPSHWSFLPWLPIIPRIMTRRPLSVLWACARGPLELFFVLQHHGYFSWDTVGWSKTVTEMHSLASLPHIPAIYISYLHVYRLFFLLQRLGSYLFSMKAALLNWSYVSGAWDSWCGMVIFRIWVESGAPKEKKNIRWIVSLPGGKNSQWLPVLLV